MERCIPVTERQIRLMTNSHKSQSEKLATGGGRETTAVKRETYVQWQQSEPVRETEKARKALALRPQEVRRAFSILPSATLS